MVLHENMDNKKGSSRNTQRAPRSSPPPPPPHRGKQFPTESLEATLRYPLTLTNEGNATASFAWATRGAFNVSPEKGTIGPQGKQEAEVVWTPQPGCKTSETLVLKVRVCYSVCFSHYAS